MGWQEHVGEQKRTGPTVVDRERIHDFAAGIADASPRHNDPSHPDYAAPPLVVAASIIPGTGAMLPDVDSGANFARIVHGGIDIDFRRPVREGDELHCISTFRGIEDKGSGQLILFDFEIQDADGTTVSNGQTRYFVRGDKKGAGKTEERQDPGPPTHEVTETISEGQSLTYAKGSSDTFPIHTDPAFAKSVGLPDVILHGMCTLGFSTRAVIDTACNGDASRLKSVGVRFSKMVFHGDTLTTRVWVDGDRVTFQTVNQDGRLVLDEGKATVAPSESAP